jgi:SAM-dependent methyltransferase
MVRANHTATLEGNSLGYSVLWYRSLRFNALWKRYKETYFGCRHRGWFFSETDGPWSAFVVGYDKAAEKIAEAKAHKDAQELDVKYVVATPQNFAADGTFDAATSVMVLPYASDFDDLRAFFSNTSRHLAAGGKFVSTVLNPLFSAFERNLVVRRVRKLDGNLVQMDFLNEISGVVEMNPIMHQYTMEEYQSAATKEGMKFEWKKVFAVPEAVAQKGEEFWRPCHEAQPYALLVVQNK